MAICHMSYFATSLQRWFTATSECTVSDLALESSVPQSDISRFRNGARRITLQALTKLLPAVEARSSRTAAVKLLIAYLRDETPKPYEPDVQIAATDDSPHIHEGNDQLDPLDTIARRWRDKSERDPSFAEMWITLDGYMHSTPEATDSSLANYRSTITPATLTPIHNEPSPARIIPTSVTYKTKAQASNDLQAATDKLLGP